MRQTPLSKHVAFAVDSGCEVGWGHFARCSALADEFMLRGCKVTFVVNGEPPSFAETQFGVVSGGGLGTTTALQSVGRADITVLDLLELADGVATGLPDDGFLVCIADGQIPDLPHDLAIDPNVSAVPMTDRRRLSGPQFVILRSQFDRLTRRPIRERPERLLVAFGGTDRPGLLGSALAALARGEFGFDHIDVIASNRALVEKLGRRVGQSILLQDRVRDMTLPLYSADAGLIAAGTTLHEACATGLPCAAISLGPEQAAEAQALADRGAVIYLGPAAHLTVAAIEAALLELSRREVRKRLSERARRAIDRRGRVRVVDAVLRLEQATRGEGTR